MAHDAFPAHSGPANSLRLASTARIGAHPIHPMLVPVPIACFVGVLLIADDVGNTVWRVTATGATPQTAGGAGTTTGAAPTPSPQQ